MLVHLYLVRLWWTLASAIGTTAPSQSQAISKDPLVRIHHQAVLNVALAAVFLALAVVFLIAARRAKRQAWVAAGCCPKCGYILTGLCEPRCPECGAPFEPKSSLPGAVPK